MSEDAVSTNGSGGAAQVLRPVPGDGLLARVGDLVLLCGLEPGAEDKIRGVLDVLREVAAAGGDGRRLGRRLARLMSAGDEDDYPTLCALGPAGPGWAVLVHGAAELVADTARGEVHLDGADAVTWVDRILPGPVTRLQAVLTGAGSGRSARELDGGPGADWYRLDAGTVPAGGLRLEPEGAPGQGGVGGSGSGSVPADAGGADRAGVGGAVAGGAGVGDAVGGAGVPDEPAGVPGDDLTAASDPLTRVFTTHEHEDANATEPLQTDDPTPNVAEPSTAPDHVPLTGSDDEPPTPLLAAASSTYRAGTAGDDANGGQPVPGEESWTLPPDRPSESYGTPDRERQSDADSAASGLTGLGAPRPSLGARLGGALAANGSLDAGSRGALAHDVQSREAQAREAQAAGPGEAGGDVRPDFGGDERTETVPADARPRAAAPARALVLDDGSVHPLEQGYVVGRDPDRDPDVTAGRALPLQVLDPEGVVSRAHARIEVDGSTVRVVDLGSANGTHVLEPGGDSWTRVPPHVGLELVPGMLVAVGARQLRYTTDDDI